MPFPKALFKLGLNHDMYRWSEDQLYGIDGAYLEAVASLPKTEVL
jgi:hypothetical protein